MYRETLPANCPYTEAKESEMLLYRVFVENGMTDKNFQSYVTLHPEREEYKKQCMAYGISLYNNKESAIFNAKRNSNLGKYIAEIMIKKDFGKLMLTRKNRGHYTLWLYEKFNPSSVICKIEPIV